ncbi:ParB/Srx family N-terminal domain-containing protein [Acinetobacter qingfengensis]|uniref:Chromosome partitioning protein ParB n=1 Tax=Acinetobacter qingfengensis TaxID=1262585 RepID=A0A1E7R8Y8_9GAMM|nr:ParB/Srx family N-terminal domain-containing protein [Acinetobacter qingfengensis]OEY95788.1 hypothetical protein BJI46_02365 [Acinetobacter qingfengensis]
MRFIYGCVGLALMVSSPLSTAKNQINSVPLGIIQVNLADLHPTQPAVGDRQISYKVQRYHYEPKKMFDDYCEATGAVAVKSFNRQSTLRNLQSFQCQENFGTQPNAMKTVVKAPDGQFYLTDGHHFVSQIMKVSGADTPLFVYLTHDYSQLKDMTTFAEEMQKQQLVWLNYQNQTVKFSELPEHVTVDDLKNDEYRSLMYFLREVAFKKPNQAAPFYEFYLAEWISKKVPLSTLNLSNKIDYAVALKNIGKAMIQSPSDEVVAVIHGKKYTVRDMGIYQKFNENEYKKLFAPTGKVTYAFSEK